MWSHPKSAWVSWYLFASADHDRIQQFTALNLIPHELKKYLELLVWSGKNLLINIYILNGRYSRCDGILMMLDTQEIMWNCDSKQIAWQSRREQKEIFKYRATDPQIRTDSELKWLLVIHFKATRTRHLMWYTVLWGSNLWYLISVTGFQLDYVQLNQGEFFEEWYRHYGILK